MKATSFYRAPDEGPYAASPVTRPLQKPNDWAYVLRRIALALMATACWPIPTLAQPTPSGAHVRAHASGIRQRASSLGVQVKIETLTADDATSIRQAGFAFVRFGVWSDRWHDPAYRRKVSAAFAAAGSVDLPVLVTVRSTQRLASDNPMPASANDASLEVAGARFALAVNEIEQTFGRQILAIELWNEPDLDKYWPTGNVTSTFGPFMRSVCAQLDRESHAVPVFGFGFSRAPHESNVPDSLLRDAMRDSPRCLDAVSYHAYGMSPKEIRDAATDIGSRYRLPAVITEWGVPSAGLLNGMERQGQRIGAFVGALNEMNTRLVSIYEWKDTSSGSKAREQSYGLVSASGAAKPALALVRNAIRALPDSPASSTDALPR